MSVAPATIVAEKLAVLRLELVEQAFALERQGRLDAADVAIATAARVAEVCAELEAAGFGVKVEV